MNRYILALLLFPALNNAAAPAEMETVTLLQGMLKSGDKLEKYEAQVYDNAESAIEISDTDCCQRLQAILPQIPKVLFAMVMQYGKPALPVDQWPAIENLLITAVQPVLSGAYTPVLQANQLGFMECRRFPEVEAVIPTSPRWCKQSKNCVQPIVYQIPPVEAGKLRAYLAELMQKHAASTVYRFFASPTVEASDFAQLVSRTEHMHRIKPIIEKMLGELLPQSAVALKSLYL